MDEPRDELTDALWSRVLDDWDNPTVHDAFITTSAGSSELGTAAAHYRSQLQDPEREQLAKKKLEAVTFLALQALDADKTPPSTSAPRWVVIVAAIAATLAFALLVYSLLQ